ncbi:MAG: hypothetical protein Q7V36_07165, partial [Deltaproteobacteria bacterium]|nr:hypothetical protein [Deltaproteobacteria bacterium]
FTGQRPVPLILWLYKMANLQKVARFLEHFLMGIGPPVNYEKSGRAGVPPASGVRGTPDKQLA